MTTDPGKKYALGIDIGLTGGIALLEVRSGDLLLSRVMPTKTARRGKSVIDVREIDTLLFPRGVRTDPLGRSVALVVMEDTHSFGHESRSSCFSFGRSTGRLEAWLELRQLPVELVAPQTWKALVLAGTKKDKASAIGYALARYPAAALPEHDGIADAVCMAEFARRRLLGVTK